MPKKVKKNRNLTPKAAASLTTAIANYVGRPFVTWDEALKWASSKAGMRVTEQNFTTRVKNSSRVESEVMNFEAARIHKNKQALIRRREARYAASRRAIESSSTGKVEQVAEDLACLRAEFEASMTAARVVDETTSSDIEKLSADMAEIWRRLELLTSYVRGSMSSPSQPTSAPQSKLLSVEVIRDA